MPTLTNVQVSWTKFKKSGSKNGRPWQLHSVKFEGDEEYYSLFGTEPQVGATFDRVEYEERPNGQYRNCTITKMGNQISGGATPAPSGGPAPAKGMFEPLSMWCSYSKDIYNAHLAAGDPIGAEDAVMVVKALAKYMAEDPLAEARKAVVKHADVPDDPFGSEPNPPLGVYADANDDDSSIPF